MAKKTETLKTICDLSAVQKLAIAKAKDLCVEDGDRDRVKAGEYPVDFSVHVKGTVKVGEDAETSQVNKVDPLVLLLIACDKLNGVTVESLLVEAEKRANDPDFDKDVKAFGERAKKAQEAIRQKTKSTRKGAVKFDGIVTALDIQVNECIEGQGH